MMFNTDILQAERALATLGDDPQQLDRARRRFSASPPFHKSPTLGSTRSQALHHPLQAKYRKSLSSTSAAGVSSQDLPASKGISSRPGQREKLERDREASRPFHQFLWQLARQRDLMTGKPTIRTAASVASIDINTMAYEAVKGLWDRMGIWDTEWGVMPGMSWMHERPPKWTPRADSIAAHAREHFSPSLKSKQKPKDFFPNSLLR